MAWFLVSTKDLATTKDFVPIQKSLDTLNQKVNKIMAQVQVAQEDLDQLDADLDAATQAISDRIDALAAAHPELAAADLSALRDDLETLRGLSAPTPSEPPA